MSSDSSATEPGPLQHSTFACTVTTFSSDGSFDEVAMSSLLERIGRAGVGVYVGSSSPGEGYSLSLDEVERLYALSVETLKGVVPVRAMGVEPRSADELLAYVRLAEKHDFDAMQLYCVDLGHSNKPSDAELERYFRDLLEAMHLPAVLSSHIFGGYAVPIPMMASLLRDYPHLIGINCTNPDLKYVVRVLEVAKDRADVHVGGAMQALSVMAMGGQGFLSSEANLIPGACQSIIDGFRDKNTDLMSAGYDRVIRLFSANQSATGSVRWTKTAMKVLGLPGHHMRRPLLPSTDSELERVLHELRGLNDPEIAGLGSGIPSAATDTGGNS